MLNDTECLKLLKSFGRTRAGSEFGLKTSRSLKASYAVGDAAIDLRWVLYCINE